MARVKWTKQDVINRFQEAITPQQTNKPGILSQLLARARSKK